MFTPLESTIKLLPELKEGIKGILFTSADCIMAYITQGTQGGTQGDGSVVL